MPSKEESDFRPSRRLTDTSDNKKSQCGAPEGEKKFSPVRSRNVYENKGNSDKMPEKKSDILC
jgi:hypothetical protein